jgi:hypothetical protein
VKPFADDVAHNQPPVGWVPEQDRVELRERDERSHRRCARTEKVLRVVFGHEHDLESTIATVFTSDPVGVDDAHSTGLIARAWHTAMMPAERTSRTPKAADMALLSGRYFSR